MARFIDRNLDDPRTELTLAPKLSKAFEGLEERLAQLIG
jgi:hypothetical protein